MKNMVYTFCVLFYIDLVGEPLPTAAWEWCFKVVGKEKCVLVDTYWQTGMALCFIYIIYTERVRVSDQQSIHILS